ncbi:MAG: DMT family transporter [Rhodovarius sp.]|nr:DMT family transporter [Rhodovarius sp.]
MPPRLLLGLILGLGASAIWGGHAVVARLALAGQGFHVLDLAAMRYLPAAILFAPLAWRARASLLRLGLWRLLVLTGAGGVGNLLLFVGALQYAPASHGGTIAPMTGPVVSALMGWWLLKERPTPGRVAALATMLLGVLMIGWDGLGSDLPLVWLGDLLLVAAGATWGCFGALIRLWQVPAIPAAAGVSILSALLVAPPWLIGPAADFLAMPLSLQLWMIFAQGVLLGVVSLLLFARSLEILGPTRTATLSVFVPVAALLLAALILEERMGTLQLLGAAVAVGGMLAAVLFTGRR